MVVAVRIVQDDECGKYQDSTDATCLVVLYNNLFIIGLVSNINTHSLLSTELRLLKGSLLARCVLLPESKLSTLSSLTVTGSGHGVHT